MKPSHLTVALLLLLLANASSAQDKLKIIKTKVFVISRPNGKELKKNYRTLAHEAMPDVYEAQLTSGRPQKVTFITDIDSISFIVEEGK